MGFFNKRNQLRRKGTNEIAEGSLKDIAKKQGVDVATAFLDVDTVVLVDTSGSMDQMDAPRGSRHDQAEHELRELQRNHEGRMAVVSFSDDVMINPNGIPYRFSGGTRMAHALRFVHRLDGTGVRFILISDGAPNSQRETLKVAQTFTSPISTIFIGPEDDRYGGREFLQELAAASGGVFAQGDDIAVFEKQVERLMLEVDP